MCAYFWSNSFGGRTSTNSSPMITFTFRNLLQTRRFHKFAYEAHCKRLRVQLNQSPVCAAPEFVSTSSRNDKCTFERNSIWLRLTWQYDLLLVWAHAHFYDVSWMNLKTIANRIEHMVNWVYNVMWWIWWITKQNLCLSRLRQIVSRASILKIQRYSYWNWTHIFRA